MTANKEYGVARIEPVGVGVGVGAVLTYNCHWKWQVRSYNDFRPGADVTA